MNYVCLPKKEQRWKAAYLNILSQKVNVTEDWIRLCKSVNIVFFSSSFKKSYELGNLLQANSIVWTKNTTNFLNIFNQIFKQEVGTSNSSLGMLCMYKVALQKNSEKCRMKLEVWMMMYPISKIYTHSNASRALSRISKHPNLLVKKYLPMPFFPIEFLLLIIYLVILIPFDLT